VCAERLSPDRRRRLVSQRRADYQTMKSALDRAARRRAQEAIVLGLTDPGPLTNGHPDTPTAPGEVVADDTALLDILEDDQ
jgi:hypothetical protein